MARLLVSVRGPNEALEAARGGAHIVDVRGAFSQAARNGIVGNDLMLEHLHPNLRGYFEMADAFYEAFREREMIGAWHNPIPRDVAWREIPVTEVDRLYGEYRIRRLMSDWPFSKRQIRFRANSSDSAVKVLMLVNSRFI